MNNCPECHRPLLSHASARCNWCGHPIEDAAYQEQAARERDAFFRHQAERDALELARTNGINVNDPYAWPGQPIRRAPAGPYPQGQPYANGQPYPQGGPGASGQPGAQGQPHPPRFGQPIETVSGNHSGIVEPPGAHMGAVDPSFTPETRSPAEDAPAEPPTTARGVRQRFARIDLDDAGPPGSGAPPATW